MGDRGASDGELVVRCVLACLAEMTSLRPDDLELARRLVESLRTVPMFASRQARLSIDLAIPETSTWYIAASTDPAARIGDRYSTAYGLTGWAIRTGRRAHLHFYRGAERPTDIVSLKDYAGIKSAFLWVIRSENRTVGAVCVVSDDPDAVSSALVEWLVIACAHIKIALARTSTGGTGPVPALAVAPRLPEGSLYEWLTTRLHGLGYDQAYFWSWDPRNQTLTPRSLSVSPSSEREIWPGQLRLGQGFVGRCAAELKSVIEAQVENGRGIKTKIESPYWFVRDVVPLRSIAAYPVHDANRLYGVLCVLSDAVGQFAEDDKDLDRHMFEIVATLREQLQSAEQRALESLQKTLAIELLNSLARPDSPNQFWNKVGKILKQLESRGLCTSCALFVRKRVHPMHYSCKATSPRAADLKQQQILANEHPEFRTLLSVESSAYREDNYLKRPPLDTLLREPGAPYWVMHSLEELESERGRGPLFFVIAMLEPESPHRRTFSVRVPTVLTQVFTGVFAVARAIFTAADNLRIGRERMRIFSAATHDLRGPVAAIRSQAESLAGLSGDDAESRAHILRLADDAMLRIENVLYEWSATDQRTPVPSSLVPWTFVSDIVEQVNANIPGKVLVFPNNDAAFTGYVLHGHAFALNLALKNVLDNAIKFGKEQPVHVKISVKEADAGSAAPYRLTIEVRDYGIGIPVADRRSVFDYGFRTDHSRKRIVKGAGVGLSITKAIIESHGGSIWVDTSIQPTTGTQMVMVLPLDRRS